MARKIFSVPRIGGLSKICRSCGQYFPFWEVCKGNLCKRCRSREEQVRKWRNNPDDMIRENREQSWD